MTKSVSTLIIIISWCWVYILSTCTWRTVRVHNGRHFGHVRIIEVSRDVEVVIVTKSKRPPTVGSIHVVKILKREEIVGLYNARHLEYMYVCVWLYIEIVPSQPLEAPSPLPTPAVTRSRLKTLRKGLPPPPSLLHPPLSSTPLSPPPPSLLQR